MRVVLFGDSLTFGYGVWPKDNLASLLQQARPQWEILNRGVNGDTTREAEERFEADVLSCHPDLVTFFFGSNDSAPGEGELPHPGGVYESLWPDDGSAKSSFSECKSHDNYAATGG